MLARSLTAELFHDTLITLYRSALREGMESFSHPFYARHAFIRRAKFMQQMGDDYRKDIVDREWTC